MQTKKNENFTLHAAIDKDGQMLLHIVSKAGLRLTDQMLSAIGDHVLSELGITLAEAKLI
jgi:hypothetical protein